jgi:hypothetical protein
MEIAVGSSSSAAKPESIGEPSHSRIFTNGAAPIAAGQGPSDSHRRSILADRIGSARGPLPTYGCALGLSTANPSAVAAPLSS